MTTNINKAPEHLLAGEILELFNSDCLLPSKAKLSPFPVLEQLLASYVDFLGVRCPSPKQLGAFLTLKYPKVIQGTTTFYQVGINPAIIEK